MTNEVTHGVTGGSVESYWLTDRTSIRSFFCYVNFMPHMFWRLFLYLVLKKFMKKQEAIYSCPSFCGKIQIFTGLFAILQIFLNNLKITYISSTITKFNCFTTQQFIIKQIHDFLNSSSCSKHDLPRRSILI